MHSSSSGKPCAFKPSDFQINDTDVWFLEVNNNEAIILLLLEFLNCVVNVNFSVSVG